MLISVICVLVVSWLLLFYLFTGIMDIAHVWLCIWYEIYIKYKINISFHMQYKMIRQTANEIPLEFSWQLEIYLLLHAWNGINFHNQTMKYKECRLLMWNWPLECDKLTAPQTVLLSLGPGIHQGGSIFTFQQQISTKTSGLSPKYVKNPSIFIENLRPLWGCRVIVSRPFPSLMMRHNAPLSGQSTLMLIENLSTHGHLPRPPSPPPIPAPILGHPPGPWGWSSHWTLHDSYCVLT